MKRFICPFIVFIVLIFCEGMFAQQLYTIYLNENVDSYVNPLEVTVHPGDQIKFVSTGGDFDITIPNASNFLNVKGSTLKIQLTSSSPASQIYDVVEIEDDIDQDYEVVHILSGGVPTAPPRIIIRTTD